MTRELLAVFCGLMFSLWAVAPPASGQEPGGFPDLKLRPYHPTTPSRAVRQEWLNRAIQAERLKPAAPLVIDPFQFSHWSFTVTSSRDGNSYPGVMVGNTALNGGANPSSVPVQIIPVIVNTVVVGTGFDFTGAITTSPGDTTFNPTAADGNCLASPNNVPVKLLKGSPLFKSARFNFGGTDVGVTQYADAFQRAQFWNTINQATYHVRLAPLTKLAPRTMNVPAPSNGTGGLALDLPNLLPGSCGRMALVDFDSIDAFVTSQFAALAAQGVTPGTLPIFIFYNTGITLGDPAQLVNCCAGGYHNAVPAGSFVQTYAVADFDTSGAFGVSALDTAILSHEATEWMNDPIGTNPTPSWGNNGQVQGCQSNLEVADPLTGAEAPRIFMPNGFTYHLQEVSFFSWFFGAVNGGPASVGLNGWFSNNGTFLTDAGPPCL